VINPIRRIISEGYVVSADIVNEMIADSPFIPFGHDYIYCRGILHFIGGEDLEAASILVPQLENSLRHILALKGIDTTSLDENGIQTAASLSVLLNPKNEWRPILEGMILPRHVQELDLLFNFAGGPAIRNDIAHGKIPAGGYWDHNMVYGTWLIIRLALLPLAGRWGDVSEARARVRFVRTVPNDEAPGSEADHT
jgi:hypothetical protein